uniref:Uncharacterized protein n=1 Tax=Arundo donax TaxID=35708 RepID=A0A0A9AG56_ARUDO
MCKICWITP